VNILREGNKMDKDKAMKIYDEMREFTYLKRTGRHWFTDKYVTERLLFLFGVVIGIRESTNIQFPEIEETAIVLGLKEEDIRCLLENAVA
jgi:hypothetical protein